MELKSDHTNHTELAIQSSSPERMFVQLLIEHQYQEWLKKKEKRHGKIVKMEVKNHKGNDN